MKKNEEKEQFDVVIAGSGMGGLMCGAILSLKGFRVGVLEKHHQIGGNLQTFKRKGVVFNSAMHFVGTMEKGQILHQVFKYLGVLDSTGLERLDPEHYEKIYKIEKAVFDMRYTQDDLTIHLSASPAVMHIKEKGHNVSELFCETIATVNETICENTPYDIELLEYYKKNGAYRLRFFRRDK